VEKVRVEPAFERVAGVDGLTRVGGSAVRPRVESGAVPTSLLGEIGVDDKSLEVVELFD
jgi:hypothetical protein